MAGCFDRKFKILPIFTLQKDYIDLDTLLVTDVGDDKMMVKALRYW